MMGVYRYVNVIPLGVVLDGLIWGMLFSMFLRQIHIRDWSFAKNPVSLVVLIWMVYNLIAVLNPVAASRMAWVYSVRSMAGLIIFYFIVLFSIDNLRYLKKLIAVIVGMGFLAALYGYKQEFIGFTDAEFRWMHQDPERYKLIFQWGHIRIFSFLSDPTAFGIIMSYTGVFCMGLLTGPMEKHKRLLLLAATLFMFGVVIFTGTRTAYAMIPFGVVLLALLTMNKFILGGTGLALVFGAILMVMPTGNVHLYRIQSAFQPGDDPSMQLRLANQAYIQPFIQSHPFGGGLGSTGVWGRRFSPSSELANFPPDSGYMRVAVELGWLGLFVYCSMLFVILIYGIYHYVRVRDPMIKSFYLAFLLLIFVLVFANYPQEAITQVPTSLIFYVSLAALVKLKDFDPAFKKIEA